MDNIKIVKNVINNNDFFKLRKSEGNDNKRIYDLETFYQKKYNNKNDYKNIISNNNYNNLKSNINGLQNYNYNNNLENRNYFQDNQNQNLDSIFANDIEAENNIGKYKKKIINRSNIVEQNYKQFNEYQNNRYKKLNLRYTQEKYDDNPIDDNNRKNNYNLNYNNSNMDNNYLNNDNINYDKKENRIYKSHSLGNIFQNNFYLSDFKNQQNLNNIKNNEYMGKRRTDITDDELIYMRDYNENGFYDYCNKKVEISLDNKKMVKDKLEQEKMKKDKSRLQEQNEIIIKNKYFNNLNIQNLLDSKESKMKYKNLLDEQVKNNINNKLLNENLTFKDVVQNQYYLLKKNNIYDRNFLNKNRFVEINPYNHRNYYLGNSSLKNNTITNPKVQYKYNRYIFPQISSDNNIYN